LTLRIAHLSDIHFGGELRAAVDAAPKAVEDFDPTVVAVTGDITLNGLPSEFYAAREWLRRLRPPLVVTPGNHDTPYWNLPLRTFAPFDRYRRFIGQADQTAFDVPGLSMRSLNSARGGQPRLDWSKGAIALKKLEAINWGEGARVFVCHHPLIDLKDAPVTGGVRRGDRAAAMLADAGVELILTGHVHVPFALPLMARTYAVGAGTLSQRTRAAAPPSFTTIAITDSAFEVEVQAWTGERFELAQAWRLPRRPEADAARA
jgi:3',5'-cyclic AMP phosphodiesterase CpdA